MSTLSVTQGADRLTGSLFTAVEPGVQNIKARARGLTAAYGVCIDNP